MIRIASLCALALTVVFAQSVTADHHEDGFVSLFDGKSLEGWDGNPKFWSVKEGAITGQTTKDNPTNGNTFIVFEDGEVGNFELRLKYRIIGGNSGIQYRSKELGDWVIGGYQADIDSGDTFSGIVYEERGRGILAKRGEMTYIAPTDDGKHQVEVIASLGNAEDIGSEIKKEDWNDYRVIAYNRHLIHIINGRVTSQVYDYDADHAAASGLLALQLHAGPPMLVQFKDIRIKKLK